MRSTEFAIVQTPEYRQSPWPTDHLRPPAPTFVISTERCSHRSRVARCGSSRRPPSCGWRVLAVRAYLTGSLSHWKSTVRERGQVAWVFSAWTLSSLSLSLSHTHTHTPTRPCHVYSRFLRLVLQMPCLTQAIPIGHLPVFTNKISALASSRHAMRLAFASLAHECYRHDLLHSALIREHLFYTCVCACMYVESVYVEMVSEHITNL